jgi:N-acyl-D-amino-acid deacylase
MSKAFEIPIVTCYFALKEISLEHPFTCEQGNKMTSTLFRDGKVVDGTGDSAFPGHVLLEDDRIRAVIRQGEGIPAADNIIDAAECVVSPGFIDMHSHSDWIIPARDHPDLLKSLLEQGITTFVGGNCGISPAPVRPETLNLVKAFAAIAIDRPFEFTWSSMAEFLDRVEETEPVMNLAQLAGHASIRHSAADTRRGRMSKEELDICLDKLRRSLDEGACGLSFGLGYDPGMYSPLDELEAFCRVAAEAEKPVTVHLKALSWISPCYPYTSLKAHNVRALEEMLAVAGRTGVKLQLSHFIFVGRRSWRTAPTCIQMVEDARGQGMDVMIDAFPYTCGNTTIHAPFPYWFLANIPVAYKSRSARARLRLELELGFRLVGFMYKDFQVMDPAVPGWDDLNGLRIDEIAQKWNTSSFDAMLTLSEKSHGATLMLFHTYSGEPGKEDALEAVLKNDLCLFETDVALKSKGYPNPSGLGTFPKILGDYARDKKLFSMENAVKRMTYLSADRFGLKDRGLIAPGKAADIVVFDPETISDNPPKGPQPAGRPTGIRHVFINGKQVVKNGTYIQGSRPGRVLRA